MISHGLQPISSSTRIPECKICAANQFTMGRDGAWGRYEPTLHPAFRSRCTNYPTHYPTCPRLERTSAMKCIPCSIEEQMRVLLQRRCIDQHLKAGGYKNFLWMDFSPIRHYSKSKIYFPNSTAIFINFFTSSFTSSFSCIRKW
jgi:hypothetical protein